MEIETETSTSHHGDSSLGMVWARRKGNLDRENGLVVTSEAVD